MDWNTGKLELKPDHKKTNQEPRSFDSKQEHKGHTQQWECTTQQRAKETQGLNNELSNEETGRKHSWG